MKHVHTYKAFLRSLISGITLVVSATTFCHGADRSLSDNPELAKYFEQQVAMIEQDNSLENYATLEEWMSARAGLREQLFEMLGLSPRPKHGALMPKVTGIVQEEEFRVEKLHFQSLPGLYVTANLYLPNEIDEPLPVVLYVCGHARVRDGNVSYGNKVGYQHHGAWFARNGYACLTIDTLQLGEIEGIHHGTYRHNRWWWNAHGYTPAGVEAWNCIRALDYLETRPEMDAERIGVTGRSGGGAYSWWIAALDDRIKCAVPVAGITTLRNHVVDGCVEGHCDCMYMTNRYRWDYATVAALVAPRPLLISNSDKDGIFPLDGVVEIHRQVRHIYELHSKPQNLGLQITEGPHKDTQELRVHAFRWLNRWLKNDDSLIEKTATKFFEPPQLRVFETLASDERNTRIDEDFVAIASAPDDADQNRILLNQENWREEAIGALKNACFAAWPGETPVIDIDKIESLPLNGIRSTRLRFQSEDHVSLFVDVFSPAEGPKPARIQLLLPEADDWQKYSNAIAKNTASSLLSKVREAVASQGNTVAVFFPRGSGPNAWVGNAKKQIQIRRRFQLLGTTVDAMRVWDVRSASAVIRRKSGPATSVSLEAAGREAWLGLMAIITDSDISAGKFSGLKFDRDEMAVFPDVARVLATEELIALAAACGDLELKDPAPELVKSAQEITADLSWTGGSLSVP